MSRTIHRSMIATLGIAAAGCGADAGERAAAPVVRDSAGIAIVENTAPAWRAGTEWRMAEVPAVAIGMMDGPPEYQLHRVRGARRLPDGRIVVTNGGTSELRFYSPEGRYLLSAGGSGSGPGEFRNIFEIEQLGDSVRVWDVTTRRLSVFTSDGGFVRTATLEGGGLGMLRYLGSLADGSALLSGIDMPGAPSGGGPAEIRQRQEAIYIQIDGEGTVIDTVGRTPGPEMITRAGDGVIMVTNVTYSSSPQLVARGERVVFSAGDAYELEYRDLEGRVERLVRRAHTPERVTPEHLRALGEARRAQAPPGATLMDPVSMPHAEFFPPHGALHIDSGGNVWVLEFAKPGPRVSVSADVFDGQGSWLGTVALPDRFRPLDIGDDYLLGVWTDEFDVEYLHLHELTKP
jgi:hypothetical protein